MSFFSLFSQRAKRRKGLCALVLGTANGVFSAVSAVTGQSHAMILGFGVAALICTLAVAWIGYWERTKDHDLEQGKAVHPDPNFESQIVSRMTTRVSKGPLACSPNGMRRGQKRGRQSILTSISAARLRTLKEVARTIEIPGLRDILELALEIVEVVSVSHRNKRLLCRLAKESAALAYFIMGVCTQRHAVDTAIFLLLSSRAASAIRILEQIRNFTRMVTSRDSSDQYIFVEADREVIKFYLKRLATYRQQFENDIVPEDGVHFPTNIVDCAETKDVTLIDELSVRTKDVEEQQKTHPMSGAGPGVAQQQPCESGDEELILGRIANASIQEPKRLHGACTHCKKLKMRCEFEKDTGSCKRCLRGDRECIVEGRKPRCAPSRREYLLAQIQTQRDTIEKLMAQLAERQKTEESQPPSLVSDTDSDTSSSSVDTPLSCRSSYFGEELSPDLDATHLEESKAHHDGIRPTRNPLAQLGDGISGGIHKYRVVKEPEDTSSNDEDHDSGGGYGMAIVDIEDQGLPETQTNIEKALSVRSRGVSRSEVNGSVLRRRRRGNEAVVDGGSALGIN